MFVFQKVAVLKKTILKKKLFLYSQKRSKENVNDEYNYKYNYETYMS